MIPYNPEETFFCASCEHEKRVYYRSEYNEELCIHCDTEYDYDDEGDRYEDDSESPWNE